MQDFALSEHLDVVHQILVVLGGWTKVEVFVLLFGAHGDAGMFEEDGVGVFSSQELGEGDWLINNLVHVIGVAAAVAVCALLKDFVHGGDLFLVLVGLDIGLVVLEDELGVEEAVVDEIRGEVVEADDEDFGGDEATSEGFGGFDLSEELVEDPDEGVVVGRAEDFGDKGAPLFEELGGETQGGEDEVVLVIGILGPAGADVGGAIVKEDVGFCGKLLAQ